MAVMKGKNTNREMVFDGRLGRYRPLLNREPVWTGAASICKGLRLEKHRAPSFELSDGFFLNTVIFLHQSGPVVFETKQRGRFQEERIHPGDISMAPPGLRHSIRCRQPVEVLCLSLDNAIMACAASDFERPGGTELDWKRGIQDPLVREIILTLVNDLQNGRPLDGIYAESLSHTLATHLLQKHAVNEIKRRNYGLGLPKHLLRSVLEFIDAHYQENLTLQTLARQAGLSPFHFSRLFKLSMGEPPYRYLLRRRLRRGAELLAQGDLSIAGIAQRAGFADQSHFAAHFKRIYGLTPTAFLRSKKIAGFSFDEQESPRPSHRLGPI
jgi:AraC family transcriptional regulator